MKKKEGIETHKRWEISVNPSDICAYSDGSSEGHGRSSWGIALQRNGTTFYQDCGIIHGGEVNDAEIIGAAAALKAAIEERSEEKLFVLLDNQAAVGALQTGKTSSSIRSTRVFNEVAQRVGAKVRWVPGHSGITGNEDSRQ